VARDVVQGRVSHESAERDYGVVVGEDGAVTEVRRPPRAARPFFDRGPGYEELRSRG
jgi:N-methylhydantoinase B/oxoprolinase/acetone carboxylase alpha subunit